MGAGDQIEENDENNENDQIDENEDAEEPLSFRTLVKPENIENENEKKTDIHGVEDNSKTATEEKLNLKIESLNHLLKSKEKQNELLILEKKELEKKIEAQGTNYAKLLDQYEKTVEENKMYKDKVDDLLQFNQMMRSNAAGDVDVNDEHEINSEVQSKKRKIN